MPYNLRPDLSANFLKRFEIFIPIKYNDGMLIPAQKIRRLYEELMEAFGGVSIQSPFSGSGVDGFYVSAISQALLKDKSYMIMVLSNDSDDSLEFFRKNLPRWEKTFKQEKILVMMYQIFSI